MVTHNRTMLCRALRQALNGIAFVTIGCVTAANAQNAPNAQAPVTMSTNVKGVSIVVPPPAGFNALTASKSERALYAIPPEPDKSNVNLHAMWQQAVAGSANNRATQVEVTETNLSNGPNRAVGGITQQTNNIVSATSYNWSGTSVVASGATGTPLAIISTFVIPTAHVPFGTCNDTWYYSSQWPGIDGNGSSDVLQGGVEADAICDNNSTTGYYSAWVEWYPYNETRVTQPAVNPGDLILVEVWNTSTTQGYVYFYNYSTQQSAQYSLTPPSGTTLKSNSVEWIVERPGINGSLANLTNYIDVPWSYGIAWNYEATSPSYHYMGASPPGATLQEITMLDNNGNAISYPTIENPDFIWFQDTGSAY